MVVDCGCHRSENYDIDIQCCLGYNEIMKQTGLAYLLSLYLVRNYEYVRNYEWVLFLQ